MAVISARGLRKAYGDTVALDGVDLDVAAGTVLGLLGPNGAGKTTAVRVLTTLLRPDAGEATVAGVDVTGDPHGVRRQIGLAGQYAAVDENLTGRENLRMVGRLYHLGRDPARARADELLEQFALTDAADRLVRTYSGGMRRRLDLAASLVANPPVLFLDEPTTGLDPRSRLALWDLIESLVDAGTTVLLTTQYLEEADRLADRIAVIDQGRVIAEGTSDQLKDRVGGAVVEARVAPDDEARARDALEALGTGACHRTEDGHLTVPANGTTDVAAAARGLEGAGIDAIELGLRRPTLDDVFLALTGRAAAEVSVPPSRNGEGPDAAAESGEAALHGTAVGPHHAGTGDGGPDGSNGRGA
ncbi:ATP-binding cassette domain-containing protein [Egibacter rhizosphaerae]|uniref:ATP-binding cassette domain-containing protein n=1 Tax=Egibacter rhizosphaerae TaxID=1670831 RepID=A0A411YEG8_9ACTN|nr:ATP-binding cassette domain-containing protein [Egibacter rhizosphaerae]QBI19654.1 ATP-binding cassette domain-containing protein [Egibacter rhizosphaerae]